MSYIQTKLFSDILEEGYTYPDFIPQALQEVINSWYQFRNVCDDKKFAAMFDRILKRDYDRYDQLLRIDPTVSSYDWLVQVYRERLLERENTGSTTENTAGSVTDTTTYGHTIGTTGRGTDTEQTVYGHAISGQNTNDTQTTKTLNTTKQSDIDDSETDSLRTTGQNVTSISGSTDTTEHGANYTDTNSQKTMGKDMPYSNSYASTSGIPGSLDWSNPSTQAEVAGETRRTYDGNAPGVSNSVNQSTTTEEPDETNARTITRDNSTTVRDTGTVTDVIDGSKTSSTTHSGTDTKTIARGSGSDITHEGSDRKATDSESEVTKTSTESGTDKEIYTGRNEDPATILRRASAFISNSSAWEWLKSRLDVCFMQVYNETILY